jgi:predicted nucleic acid-binding protein
VAIIAQTAPMMIVDSNVWADYFNGRATAETARLESALRDAEDLATLPIIVTEVLQGFRSDLGFQRAQRELMLLTIVEPDVEVHISAARLYRMMRRRGVTIRGTIDCVIAQACLESHAELLSPDQDFEQIARFTELRLWRSSEAH